MPTGPDDGSIDDIEVGVVDGTVEITFDGVIEGMGLIDGKKEGTSIGPGDGSIDDIEDGVVDGRVEITFEGVVEGMRVMLGKLLWTILGSRL